MSTQNDIDVRIGADTGELDSGMDRAAKVVQLKSNLVNDILRKNAEEAATIARRQAREMEEQAKKQAEAVERAHKESADRLASIGADLQNRLLALFSAGAIIGFVKSTKQAVVEAEASYRGLEAVANYTGVGIGNAMKAAGQLAADGLMSTAEASKALQNLLSRGYSLDQAMDTLARLKDAAAFNRQANLEMGEAVVNATEGLKNENSVLVDNAGVTKNVAKMWEEYADKLGKSTNDLTTAEKIQAEYNGVMAETEAQVGNAAKAAGGLQGQQAQLEAKTKDLMIAIGQGLTPAFTAMASAGIWVINNFVKPMAWGIEALGITAAAAATKIGILWDAATSLNFTGLSDKLKQADALKEQMLTESAARYEAPMTGFEATPDSGKRKAPEAPPPPDKQAQEEAKAAERAQDKADKQNNDFDRAMFEENLRVEREFFAKKGELITQQRALDMQAASDRKAATLGAIAAEEMAEQHRFQMGLITYEELLAAQQQFLEQKKQAEDAYLAEKLAQVDPDLDPVEYARIKAEMLEVERAYQMDKQQIINDLAVSQAQPVSDALGSIETSMAGSIQRLLTMQISVAGFLKSLWQGVTGAIAAEASKMAAAWIMNKIKLLIFGKTAAASEISGQAAKAGAGGVASMAAAPWPLNMTAPAFGAAMSAAAMAFAPMASFAQGAWELPGDMVAQVHKGETILPAPFAEDFRNNGGSLGGGSGGITNINIQALDGHSVRQLFMDNGHHLADAIKEQARGFRT